MSEKKPKIIWVSWESHRRTSSIVEKLDIPLFTFQSKRHRLIKHPTFVWRTLWVLLKNRPEVLIVQSPSILLNLIAVLWRPLFRYKLVVDAHNAGVYSCDPLSDRVAWLYPYLQKRAEVTIVTNDVLARMVTANGGVPRVLVDPLPALEVTGNQTIKTKDVTFICTYAFDEPFDEVFQAARLLPPGVTVHVTGNVEANRHLIKVDVPASINFTGFLPEEDFVNLLATSAVVIDLTTWDDCLVCGGYESMALGTPLILSDSPVNRATFARGALYCHNTVEGIAAAIEEALAKNQELRLEAVEGGRQLNELFDSQLETLDLAGLTR